MMRMRISAFMLWILYYKTDWQYVERWT